MKKFMKEWGAYILIVIAIILIRSFIVTPVMVKGTSMENNFYENEVLLLSKINYKFESIKRFDVVVVDNGNDLIIKRVIGLPGENVEYKNNELYINNKKVEDIYQKNTTEDFDLEEVCEAGGDYCVTKIPEGKYLVLGDNRNVSSDSRAHGLYDVSDIKGKIVFRLWPFNKIKTY